MKFFKTIDCIIQFVLIAAGVGLMISTGFRYPAIGYIGIGIWQLFSTLIHLLFRQYNIIGLRQIYLYALLFLVLLYVTSYIVPNMVMALSAALFILSPVMAVYYCVVCCRETLAVKS